MMPAFNAGLMDEGKPDAINKVKQVKSAKIGGWNEKKDSEI